LLSYYSTMDESIVSAEALFQRISTHMKVILGDDSTVFENDYISETVALIEQCALAVDREYLISKNEEFDDIQTQTLKFFFLDYYEAKCYQSFKGMEDRLNNVLSSKSSLNTFLQKCTRFGLLHEEDRDYMKSSAMSADLKRNAKIDKFKRDRAAKARINEIQRMMYIARKDGEVDQEKELRELYVTQIQCYAREAIDDLDMLQQEMAMLRFHAEQQRDQESRGDNAGSEGSAADGRLNNRRAGKPDSGMFLDNYGQAQQQQHQGPGISVTRTFKVGDQIMFSRETVKSGVLGSHIAPPTVTLEEYGDQVKAEALEREERSRRDATSEDSAARAGRRYNQLEADGDEDDADLADKAAEKDRAWDDWKDNNPRGWGNKMGKRF